MADEFVFSFRVYSHDTDFTGAVHHSNYLRFFEKARVEWAFARGLQLHQLAEQGILFVIKSVEVDYKHPIGVNEWIEVVTRYEKLKRASILYQQSVRARDNRDLIYCTARVHTVCVDKQLRPQAMPKQVWEDLNGDY